MNSFFSVQMILTLRIFAVLIIIMMNPLWLWWYYNYMMTIMIMMIISVTQNMNLGHCHIVHTYKTLHKHAAHTTLWRPVTVGEITRLSWCEEVIHWGVPDDTEMWKGWQGWHVCSCSYNEKCKIYINYYSTNTDSCRKSILLIPILKELVEIIRRNTDEEVNWFKSLFFTDECVQYEYKSSTLYLT